MILIFLVILWILSPMIGYVLLKKEEKLKDENFAKLQEFVTKQKVSDQLRVAKEIFVYNGYKIDADENSIFVARKEFSFGKLFFGYFFAGVGMIIYIFYFLFLEKPSWKKVVSTKEIDA